MSISYTLVAELFVAIVSLLLICRVILQLIRIARIPPNIPWAGQKGRVLFPKLRACFGEPFAGRSNIQEGYEKYSKQGQPFILPALHWPGVVLPPSNAAWVAQQPEGILNHVKPFDDLAGFDFLGHGPSTESVHDFTVIRRDLTRQMRTLVPQVLDEISTTLDEEFGRDCQGWKEVRINDVIQTLSFRAANRIFVGLPLCRSQHFATAVKHWTISLGISGAVMRYLVPFPLRTWLGPVLALIPNLLQYRILRLFLPDVRQRLVDFYARQQDEDNGDEDGKYNDMMQWIIENNAMKEDPAELFPTNIAGKMVLLNLFAVNTTSLVASTIIFDILSHHSAKELIAELQAEAQQTMPKVFSNPKALHSMPKLDSVIRETLRFDPFLAQGMVREIMQPEGIVTPDGLHLPQGCHVHSIVSSMQRDDKLWEKAGEYDPLRHYRAGLETGKQRTAVQLDGTFLSFGLGRHACPGRFFAVHSLKLIMGYILLNYDFRPSENFNSKFIEFGEAVIPPEATMEVQRRSKIS